MNNLIALFHSLIVLCVLYSNTLLASEESSMTVRYIDRGEVDARNAHKFELIKRIMEATKPEFGDYRIEPFKDDPGAKRLAVLVSEGELLNITWASPGTVRDNQKAIQIPVDLLHGLLGDRICLVNRYGSVDFSKINSLGAPVNVRIGQGVTWEDADIYTFNKLNVVKAPNIEGLINMLDKNRFDCLALGANEIGDIFQQNRSKFPFLQIEKNILIHYDFPLYFYVSAKYPKLAERFKKGMEKIQTSGEFDEIFNRYFHAEIENLNLKSRRVICLPSPFLPLGGQCSNPIKILQ